MEEITLNNVKLVKYPFGYLSALYDHKNFAEELMDNRLHLLSKDESRSYILQQDLKIPDNAAVQLFKSMSTGSVKLAYRGHIFVFETRPCNAEIFTMEALAYYKTNTALMMELLSRFPCGRVIPVDFHYEKRGPLGQLIPENKLQAMLTNGRKLRILDFPVYEDEYFGYMLAHIPFTISKCLMAMRDFQVSFIAGSNDDPRGNNAVCRVKKSPIFEPRVLDIIFGFVLTAFC